MHEAPGVRRRVALARVRSADSVGLDVGATVEAGSGGDAEWRVGGGGGKLPQTVEASVEAAVQDGGDGVAAQRVEVSGSLSAMDGACGSLRVSRGHAEPGR